MAGIVVQLAISWLLIWLVEKQQLNVLGFTPTAIRLKQFCLFFLVTALCCASGYFLRIFWGNEKWIINPILNTSLILKSIWWNIKSVLFEELIFRGVLFYILLKRIGTLKAIIISAVAFGIYHWFSHEVIGNPVQMLTTFLITGFMGVVYAYGYAKTFSLYVPCAIHLGWNLTKGFIFSEGVIGNGVFILAKQQTPVTVSYVTYYVIIFFPLLSAMLVNYFLLRHCKQQAMPH